MSPNIDWSDNMPAEVRAAFEPLLNKHVHRCPRWMHELYVYWKTDAPTAALVTSCEYEYRQGRIGIGGEWLNTLPRLRETAIVHELLHFFVKPLRDVADELRMAYCDDKVQEGIWRERQRVGEESLVTDLARMLMESLEENRFQIHTRSHHADDARRTAEA